MRRLGPPQIFLITVVLDCTLEYALLLPCNTVLLCVRRL